MTASRPGRDEYSAYSITTCRGVSGGNCRFAVQCVANDKHAVSTTEITPCGGAEKDEPFLAMLTGVMEQSGWESFLRAHIRGPLSRHHTFSIAVAACPNGCSRPHIADVAFIRAYLPVVTASRCSQCRLCAKACPDSAITITSKGPDLDSALCQRCGLCISRCKEQAIHCGAQGYRILIGGKLGRHPRLATELPGIFDEQECASVLNRAILFYMEHYRPRLRFGTFVEQQLGNLLQRLSERAA